MMHNAKLVTESGSGMEVYRSIDVDNVSMQGLSVDTAFDGRRLTTLIRSNSVGSLLNTVDDLLRCQIAAESMVKDG